LVTRLIILAIVVLGLALMIEPEKLLYLSYFTAVLVVGLGKLDLQQCSSVQAMRSAT
jgi:hypothetical protein